ncbi:hypothetical protein [Avibacterium paragallinarum]|uniref:Uncharacterized protein n=1 Tax=Avibacterium paragallinarum TaxID=728 RepID=A0A0F5ES07_AVIPA|nr:hypothetical protein [Avibacterium paragallinarum]AZI14495.1 hypothetical protein EIA51_07645 [Avibacterium paragallinarum]MEE3608281.1 hypothetical protein [Avibacterium paragallinarum]MEE3620796.1 hypothetical protein [Avibacterium paragallinarum]MEE3668097.1 hypothetical protein [Avibacterium paragallinarum]MEE3681369.1 hypothetical protein [Avibacterium paragallinarum]
MATRAIKEAAAHFMQRFFQQLVANGNQAIAHFITRPDNKKMAIVPGRLVDQVEEALNKWREKAANGTRSPLPIFLMGFAKDYSSTGLEKGRSVALPKYTVCDDQGNFFYLRLDKHDQRVQIVLFAPDHETAFSLASQFKLYCGDYGNRHLFSINHYNDLNYGFPMQLEDSQIFGASQQIADQDNLTVLVFDLTFNCNTPYFLGDKVNRTPYLPTVQAVVLQEQQIKTRQMFFHNLEGTSISELLD